MVAIPVGTDVTVRAEVGVTGPAGSQIGHGAADPVALARDGDWYLNTTSGDLFKQVAGAWVLQVRLKADATAAEAAAAVNAAGLAQELVDRAAADTALQANIDAEAAARAAAGAAEVTARDAAIAAAVAALVDSSPGTLDTLNELADALGDDPNFAATVTGLVSAAQADATQALADAAANAAAIVAARTWHLVADSGAALDGVADDRAAVQSWINGLPAGAGLLLRDGETLTLGSKLLLGADMHLMGASRAGSVVKALDGSIAPVLLENSGGNDMYLSRLTVDGNRANTTTTGSSGVGSGTRQIGGTLYATGVTWKDCHYAGLYTDNGGSSAEVYLNDVIATGCNVRGLHLRELSGGKMTGCRADGNDNDGISFQECVDFVASDIRADNNGRHGVSVLYCQRWSMTNVRASANGITTTQGWGVTLGGGNAAFTQNRDYSLSNVVCNGNHRGGLTVDPEISGNNNVLDQNGSISNVTTFDNIELHGLMVRWSKNLRLSNINAYNNTDAGVTIQTSDLVTASGIVSTGNAYGVLVTANTGTVGIGTVAVSDVMASNNTTANLFDDGNHPDSIIQERLIDEDDMSSDSATRPPSQQSVKAFAGDLTRGRGTIDVTEHGIDWTGASDSTAPLLALIATLPDDTNLRDTFIGWTPIALYFPSFVGGVPAQYRFDTTCVLPGPQNFIITSDAPFGARFVNNTGTDYILEVERDTVGRNKTIENIFFDGGGIHMDGVVRGFLEVHHCAFRDCADWAIWFSNEGAPDYLGPVGPYVHDCFFLESGGINIDCDTYLIIRIHRNRFFRMTKESIRVDGPGVFIEENDFQEMHKIPAETRGHIHIASTRSTASDIRIRDNRWGVEGDEVTYAIPKYAIVVGDSATPVDVSSPICGSLIVEGNRFAGDGGSVNPDHGQAAIGLFGRVSGFAFIHNVVLGYQDVIIDDDYFVNNAGGSATSGGVSCLYAGNLDANHTAGRPIFKNGGYAFRVDLNDDAAHLHARQSTGGHFELAVYGGEANGALGWGGEGILLNAYNDPTRKFRLRIDTTGTVQIDERTTNPWIQMPNGPENL